MAWGTRLKQKFYSPAKFKEAGCPHALSSFDLDDSHRHQSWQPLFYSSKTFTDLRILKLQFLQTGFHKGTEKQ